MSDCVARPRSAARCRVLSRPDSATIEPPCVLAAHSPIAPDRRTSLCESFLALTLRDANAEPDARDGTDGAEEKRLQRERARAPEHRYVTADDAAESHAQSDHGTTHAVVIGTPDGDR